MRQFTKHELHLFEVAKTVALTSPHHKARVGAVIESRGEIIAVGTNGIKSHPLQQKYNQLRFRDDDVSSMDHRTHAELAALIKAGGNIDPVRAAMYVYRIMKNGSRGMARPCGGCVPALLDFKVKRVYYTTTDGFAYEELTHGC